MDCLVPKNNFVHKFKCIQFGGNHRNKAPSLLENVTKNDFDFNLNELRISIEATNEYEATKTQKYTEIMTIGYSI